MTLADATAILYGPVPRHIVEIDYDDERNGPLHLQMNNTQLTELLAQDNLLPCSIFVDGVLIRRIKP